MNKYHVTVTYDHTLLAATDFHAEAEVMTQIKANRLRGVIKVVNVTDGTPTPTTLPEKRRNLFHRHVDTEHGGVSQREDIDR